MNKELIINQTQEFVKETLRDQETSHDYNHILRVYKLALLIGKQEGANLFIVSLAALLHDIADHKFHNGDQSIGGRVAGEFLNSIGVNMDIIDAVVGIVNTISFKAGTNKDKQVTLDGMVVQDADRLDAIGAIGIARTFTYGGYKKREIYDDSIPPHHYENYEAYQQSKNHTINHFYEKLLLLKDLMNTNTGKQMAETRHQFMVQYLNQFFKEWNVNIDS